MLSMLSASMPLGFFMIFHYKKPRLGIEAPLLRLEKQAPNSFFVFGDRKWIIYINENTQKVWVSHGQKVGRPNPQSFRREVHALCLEVGQ